MPDLSGSQSAPQVSRKGITGRIPVKSVRSALQLLGRRERRLLGVATVFQM